MNHIMTINTEKATTDPEATFETPDQLVDHVGLTRGQKIAALERWSFTVRARVDALSEGMTSHPEGSYARDVELLRLIEKAAMDLKGRASGDA